MKESMNLKYQVSTGCIFRKTVHKCELHVYNRYGGGGESILTVNSLPPPRHELNTAHFRIVSFSNKVI